MTDYNYYVDNYKGNVIPDRETFDRLAVEATAYVDTLVTDREPLQYDNINAKYNTAVCAVIEVMYSQASANGISSESVGNHSITYSSTSELNKMRYDKAKIYLRGTGLMSGVMR